MGRSGKSEILLEGAGVISASTAAFEKRGKKVAFFKLLNCFELMTGGTFGVKKSGADSFL